MKEKRHYKMLANQSPFNIDTFWNEKLATNLNVKSRDEKYLRKESVKKVRR